MPNIFASKPELTEPVLPRSWKCPVSGIVVPKELDKNLDFRIALLDAAEDDVELQQELNAICAKSPLFWINCFVYTVLIFKPGADGKAKQAENKNLPYITWPIQDQHIAALEEAITVGSDLLTDKSRDMGATWDHIAILTHRLLYKKDESFLVLSKKEDSVDGLSGLPKDYPFGPLADPGTLFGKIDYILSRLPEWMLPNLLRKKLHLMNLDNNSRIDGESANATAGSGDRRQAILLDEMAKMDNGESIKQSTRAVSACRLAVSTPFGPGTAFSKWRMSGSIKVFQMPWWTHPDKARGLYPFQDDLGRWKIRSPWYDHECTLQTPKEIATEVDMDHVGSGNTFFEGDVLEKHKKLFTQPPKAEVTIKFRKGISDDKILDAVKRNDRMNIQRTPTGDLKLWAPLDLGGRLDQSKTYIISVDISKGQGASNSVICIGCVETSSKVGEWANANTPPHELARVVVAIALWVGGRNFRPLVIWENNGDPGLDFGRQLMKVYHYPKVYFDTATGTQREKVGKRYGWRSSREKKAVALGMLRRAYAFGLYINRSLKAVEEATTYITYENGGIGPAELVSESDSTRAAHGDRVIADMLFVWAAKSSKQAKTEAAKAPERSFGHRLADYKRRKKMANDKDHFDFTRLT
jgi:hypothetical protein